MRVLDDDSDAECVKPRSDPAPRSRRGRRDGSAPENHRPALPHGSATRLVLSRPVSRPVRERRRFRPGAASGPAPSHPNMPAPHTAPPHSDARARVRRTPMATERRANAKRAQIPQSASRGRSASADVEVAA